MRTSNVPENDLNNPAVKIPGKIRFDTSIPIVDESAQSREFRQFKTKVSAHEGT
jgi:hypothetical protein